MSESTGNDPGRLLLENEALRRRVAVLELEARRFKATLYSIGDAVITADADGNVLQMNHVAQALTGWSEADARGRSTAEVFKIVNEETGAEVESPVERVLREGAVVGLANHTSLIAKDGSRRPIADSGAPILDEKGEVTGVVLVFRDQTEERAAQRALAESERKFRDTVRYLDEGYYSCAPDGLLQEHNLAFNRMLGFDIGQDLRGARLPDFWQDPDDRQEYLKQLTTTGVVRNFLINAKTIQGDKLVVMASSHLVKDDRGRPARIDGTFTDFTDRKRMEEALRESEEHNRTTLNSIGDAVISTDAGGDVRQMNRVAQALTGWSEAEAIGQPLARVFRIVNEETGAEVESPVQRVLREGVVVGLANHTSLIAKDSSRRPIADSGAPIRDEKGHITGVVLVFRDQTEERAAQRALSESEAKYRNLVENASVGIFRSKIDGSAMLEANPKLCEMLGLTREEFVGHPSAIAWANPERRADLVLLLRQKGIINDYEIDIRTKSGEIRTVLLTMTTYPELGYVEGALQDITDRKRMEEALRESEEKHRSLFDNAEVGMYRSRLDGSGIIALNQRLADMFGHTKEEMLRDPATIRWADPKARDEMVKLVREAGTLCDYEIDFVTKSGEIRTSLTSVKLYPNEGYLEGSAIDITERKHAEEALKDARDRLEEAQRVARAGSWKWNTAKDEITGSAEFYRLFDVAPEGLARFSQFTERLHPDDRERVQRDVAEALKQDRPYDTDYRVQLTNGGWRDINARGQVFADAEGKPASLVGTCLDITERKRMEERVNHLNLVLKAIRNVNQLIVREKDAGTVIRRTCEVLTETRGYFGAWIALHDDSGTFLTGASAGLGDAFEPLAARIRSGQLLECARALREGGVHVVKDPAVECPGCPVAGLYKGQSAIAIRLEHGGRIHGLLVISMNADLAGVPEEQRMIEEVADDIAYALHGLDVEKRRAAAEDDLRKHRDELELLVEQRTRQLAASEQRLVKETAAVAEIVGEMLSGSLSDAETERQVLNACLDATGSVYGMIGAINEHGKYDVTAYNGRTLGDCAFPEALAWEMTTGMEIRGIWGWPMVHGKPLRCNNLPEHPERVGQPEGHVPIECFLGAPVKREGKVTGMVAVANKPGGYTEVDEQTLTRLVDVMAVSRRHRELLTELEQRVRDRTAQLEETNQELEAFSYSVSHDLRAPLRAIDGFTRVLVDDYEPQLDTEGKRICSIIRDNTHNMSRLIDDLLAFSRLGRAEMQPSRIDMGAMANAVFYELTTPESRERIDFCVGPLPAAVGDPSLMRQVWTNLLGNAIKFSSKRARAVIQVSGEPREGESVYAVQDDGAGFDMQYVQKLFGVFQRLHSTREFEGNGVGLALVQRVIRRHGGRVWAQGETDRGATFYFALTQKGA